jgi:uroporphyrinogen decarboxylase
MTSKERVLKAINHEVTDKVPVDLGSNIQATIHAYAYHNLKLALGISTGRVEIMDTYIMAAKVEDAVIDALQVDAIPILSPFDGLGMSNGPEKKEWIMPNGLKVFVSTDFNPRKQQDGSFIIEKNGFQFKMPDSGYYFDAIRYVLQDAETTGDVDNRFDFSGYGEKESEYFLEEAKRLKGSTKAVVGDVFASFSAEDNFGYENAMIYLMTERKLIQHFMERLTDMFIRNFDVFHAAVGDVADIMMMHKDMGNQLGPMVDPEVAREVFFPLFKKYTSHIKAKSNYKIMMHNCGSIYEFFPDLIDAGIDIINPVQISAKNMEPERLKREFGKDICFWGGGVDTQHVLPDGTEDEVRRQVRDNARIFSRGGGFVFNPVHCVQAGVPSANIIAAFDEISRCRND